MIRLLVTTAIVGFLACVVCITGTVAIAGRDITSGHYKPPTTPPWWLHWDNPEYSDGGAGEYASWAQGETETRSFDWSGAGKIDVGFPADVTYVQGATPGIKVTGPKATVDRFYTEGGDIRLHGWDASNTFRDYPNEGASNSNKPPRLAIEITAPGVTEFELTGTETLAIVGYDQDVLTLDASGASKVTAAGKARLLKLDAKGGPQVDLAKLALKEATLDTSGMSQITLAPQDSLQIDAKGMSQVTLTTKPARIDRDISGMAKVIEQEGPAPAPVAAAAKSPTPPRKR